MPTFLAIVLLASVHLQVGRFGLPVRLRSVWKSAAGGVGISYAFLALLPKIADAQESLRAATDGGLYGYLEHHAYLVALAGLTLHFGLDVAVDRVLVMPARRAWRPAVTLLVVGHASTLVGYFFLIGYLVSKTPSNAIAALALFTLAMFLHAFATAHGLLERYRGLYDRWLRWLFALATAAGGILGLQTEIPYNTLALLHSVFAGMLIIGTIKQKVPGTADARFGPFLAGLAGYSALLLLAEQLTP